MIAGSSTRTLRGATPSDMPLIRRMLADAGLPVEGVEAGAGHYLAIEEEGRTIGAIGLEGYGPFGLVRSAVVKPDQRGDGIGARLVEGVLALSAEQGIERLFLLTTTAAEFFERHGFVRIERTSVPVEISRSPEFATLCPATAAVMSRSVP